MAADGIPRKKEEGQVKVRTQIVSKFSTIYYVSFSISPSDPNSDEHVDANNQLSAMSLRSLLPVIVLSEQFNQFTVLFDDCSFVVFLLLIFCPIVANC